MCPTIAPELSQEIAPELPDEPAGPAPAARDLLGDHGQAVSELCGRIGAALGLRADARVRLSLAAYLHDIGKRHLPRSIVDKPGPLDAAEWKVMRRHPMIGERILLEAGLCDVAAFVRSHHERRTEADTRTGCEAIRFRSRPGSWPSPTPMTR
jgi:HD domain